MSVTGGGNAIVHTVEVGPIPRVAGDRVFRWGIIGSGNICKDFITALAQVPDAKVVAIGARNKSDADAVAKQFGIPHSFGSYEEVAALKEVDIVYVGTVHSHHHHHAALAIKHGKAVLVEKAFTQNARQAEAVLAAAKAANVFVMEAMWSRFMPWGVKVRELLQSGVIGDVTIATADFCVQFDRGMKRIFDPETAGGALLDLGIYPLSAVSLAFGGIAPERIHCDGDLLDTGVDGQMSVTLKYGHNKLAHALCSAIVDSPRFFSILGTKGRIVVHDDYPPGSGGHFHNSGKVTLMTKSGGKYKEEVFVFSRPESAGTYHFSASDMLAWEASECQRCVAAKLIESPVMTHAETLTLMKTIDTIRLRLGAILPGETKETLTHS